MEKDAIKTLRRKEKQTKTNRFCITRNIKHGANSSNIQKHQTWMLSLSDLQNCAVIDKGNNR